MPSDLAIDLRAVSKTYGGLFSSKKVHALRGIDMQVGRGEVFGLLGPNGAGKSTLVKILMTVIRASKCQGHMLGAPVGHKATLREVGYLPEHHKFPDYLTGGQVLDYFGALADVPRDERRKRSAELLDLVGIARWKDHKVKGYSKGMRQRLGVANALMNNPRLVLLDEPTDGVDPVGRRDIRNILIEAKRRGMTVFINSHLLSELELVCDRVAILVQGRVSSQGTIKELTQDQMRYDIELAPPEGTSAPEIARQLIPNLSPPPLDPGAPGVSAALRGSLPSGERIVVSNGTISVATSEPLPIQPLIDALRARAVTIKAVRPVRPSLEDLFMQAVTDPTTGETLKPGAAANAPNAKAAPQGTPGRGATP